MIYEITLITDEVVTIPDIHICRCCNNSDVNIRQDIIHRDTLNIIFPYAKMYHTPGCFLVTIKCDKCGYEQKIKCKTIHAKPEQ